jgi:hypothetical protein
MARKKGITIAAWVAEMEYELIGMHSIWMNDLFIVQSEGRVARSGAWRFYLLSRQSDDLGAMFSFAELESRPELVRDGIPSIGDVYW